MNTQQAYTRIVETIYGIHVDGNVLFAGVWDII